MLDKGEAMSLKEYSGFHIFWGDMHTNVHGKDIFFPPLTLDRLKMVMDAAEEHLDFFAIAYYPFEWYSINGLIIESCGHRERFESEWNLVREAIKKANKPGKFVTFLGYEWHGDRRRYGDHNVYYLDDGPLDYSKTIEELYANIRKNNGIAIPHHTGYQVGERGKDWNYFDEELSPVAEIYSSHGSSEGVSAPRFLDSNINMGPGTSGGTILDGLNRGYKFGIIASGDNHRDFPGVWGNGLVAVFAKELTKEAIWDAIKKRRAYGVTGDRIQLYFSINGHIMGEAFNSRNKADINVEVTGSDAIDTIQIIKNGKVIYTYFHYEKKFEPKGEIRVKIRLQCGWGPTSFYGFKNLRVKELSGSFKVSDGEIISVEPCYTYFGQKVKFVSPNEYNFKFKIQPRTPLDPLTTQHHRTNLQGAIFEIKAHPESSITIQVNAKTVEFSLKEAIERERLIALIDEAKLAIQDNFGLRPEEIENPDIFWHNAWKIRVSKAVPFERYHAKVNYIDNENQEGENYYYVRVIQSNGQMAWSSPIWIRNLM
jgi:hypothetical protein